MESSHRKPMKIAIFTDAFLPQTNGIVTATLDMARGLADRGHRIYIIAPKFRKAKEFTYPNVIVKRMSSLPALFYPNFKFTSFFSPSIIRFLMREKVDIIHFQTPLTIGLQGVLAAKILGIPLVGTFHTFFADKEYLKHAGLDFKIAERLAWNYSNAYYNKCDLITCPTQSARRELLKNRVRRKIVVISNGIDESIFENRGWKDVKKKYNPRGPILLFVGRIAYEKNIPYLLECFRLVVEKIPGCKLLMVGDGPQLKAINHLVDRMGLGNSVIMTGNIPHGTLVKSGIFKACDVFVTASKTETQGITMLEAQGNGLVSVALDARGTSDLIRNGRNGFLVRDGDRKEFSDRIVQLLTDKKLRGRMKRETMKEIKDHYLYNVLNEWEKEYRKLI